MDRQALIEQTLDKLLGEGQGKPTDPILTRPYVRGVLEAFAATLLETALLSKADQYDTHGHGWYAWTLRQANNLLKWDGRKASFYTETFSTFPPDGGPR